MNMQLKKHASLILMIVIFAFLSACDRGGGAGNTDQIMNDPPDSIPSEVRVGEVRGNTASYNAIAEFGVSLNNEPSGDVVIPIYSTNENEGALSESQLTFTRENWNQTQTVVVKGRNREVVDGIQDYKIILSSAQSSDDSYNGIDPNDVEMKGIFLSLEPPTDSLNFISGIPSSISTNTTYTGNNQLSYSLVENPDGMTIDINSGVISWTAPESEEGEEHIVTVKATDGRLFSERDLNIKAITTNAINTVIQDDSLIVSDSNNSLNGLELKSMLGSNLEAIKLDLVNEIDAPYVPPSIDRITSIFVVNKLIEGSVLVKFPKSLIPENSSIYDLKIFHHRMNLKDQGDEWISLGTNFDLEGSSDNPVVVVEVKDVKGLYFIGIHSQNLEILPLFNNNNENLKRSTDSSSISCMPFSNIFPDGITLTTYKIQDCEVLSTGKKFRVEGFSNVDDTSSGTHWNGVSINDFVVWLVNAQDAFDTLSLNYKDSVDVIVEPISAFGSYDGTKLHISSGYTKEVQRSTVAHEYIHHAQIETLINGASNAANRTSRYWQTDGDWIWEGIAYWFEDYIYDNANLYVSDKVGENPSPRVLEKGVNAYSYDMFSFWKLLSSSCISLNYKNVFDGVMDNTWGATSLDNTLPSSNCNFGSQLGPNKSSSLESALLYYQYATLYKNKISLLDSNEDDDKFSFIGTPYQYAQSDWGEVNEVESSGSIDVSNITSIPAYGAYSIKINSDLFTNADLDEDHEAVFKVKTSSLPLTVSLLSEHPSFIGNSQLDGIQHRHYKTNEISEYIFSQDELVDFFITLVNANDRAVSIQELSFEIREKLSPELEITSPSEGDSLRNRVISVTGKIPGDATNVDRVIVGNGEIKTVATVAADKTFSADVVITVGENILIAQGYSASDLTKPLTKESIINITGVESTSTSANALIASRVALVLRWETNNTDIDIYSTDVNGGTIWFNDPSVYPGLLDFDNVSGYGPEVISYRAINNPVFVNGKFDVDVHFYSGSIPTPYTLDVIMNETDAPNLKVRHYKSIQSLPEGNRNERGENGSGASRFNDILSISCSSQQLCSISSIDSSKLTSETTLILSDAEESNVPYSLRFNEEQRQFKNSYDKCISDYENASVKLGVSSWYCDPELGSRVWY